MCNLGGLASNLNITNKTERNNLNSINIDRLVWPVPLAQVLLPHPQLIFPSKTKLVFGNLFEFSGAEMGKIWNSFVEFTILIE
jgi:hypothetical protein